MWIFWEDCTYYSIEDGTQSSNTNIHNVVFTEWEQVKKYANETYTEIITSKEPYKHNFKDNLSEADFAEYDEIDVFHVDLDYGCYIIGNILKMKKADTTTQKPS